MSLRLQSEIVKNSMLWKWDYDESEEVVYFTDGVVVRKIPVRECLLDLSKFEQADLIKYFQDEGNWPVVEPTKFRFKTLGYTAISLEGNGQQCWINESHYKTFKKYTFEYNGGNWVQIRHPETIEVVAVVAIIRVDKDRK